MSETPFDVERLAEHAGFVRALARSLLRGERGDDVAQQALTVALSRPPPVDHGPSGLRAWLSTVTRRLARDERRGAERRERREQGSARPEAADSTAEVAARMESMRRLLAALAELPESDRVVLVMRFYESQPPRRIAAALDIPVNTVRTRLQRALERLRASYLGPADQDGTQAKERERRLAGLALLSGGAGLMGAKQTVAVGTLAAVLLVVAGIVAWRWSAPKPGRSEPSSIAAPARAEAPVSLATVPTEATRDATPSATPTEAAVSARWVHLRGRLRDRAGNAIHLEHEFGVIARYFQPTSTTGRDAGHRLMIFPTKAVEDGTFEARISATGSVFGFASGPLARVDVRLAPPGYLAVTRTIPIPDASAWPKEGDLEVDCEIVVLTATTITARVVDEAGKPVNEMVAALFRRLGSELVLVPGSECNTWQHSFSIAAAGAGTYELVVTPPRFDTYSPKTAWVRSSWGMGDDFVMKSDQGSLPTLEAATLRALSFLPIHRTLELRGEAGVDLGDLVVQPGESIRGRIAVEPPWSAAGAIVSARRRDPRDESEVRWLGSPRQCGVLLPGFERAGACGVADAAGEFEIAGLTPGKWFVGVTNLADVRVIPELGRQSIVEADAPDDEVELRLGGALVRVEVHHDGKPLAGANIVVGVRGAQEQIALSAGSGQRNITDGTGRGAVAVPAGATVTVGASCSGFTRGSRSLGTLAAGQVVDVVLDLDAIASHPSLIVQVRTAAATPIERCGIRVRPSGEPVDSIHEKGIDGRDETGCFVLDDLPPGRWTLRARPGGEFEGGDGFYAEITREIEVIEGKARGVELIAEPAGRVRVAARRADGAPLAARCTFHDAANAMVATTFVSREEDDQGRWQSSRQSAQSEVVLGESECLLDPPLAPGNYTATFALAGFRTLVQPFVVTASRCTFVDAILDPE